MRKILILFLSLSCFSYRLSSQTTYTVCASGCNFTTIQAAIDAAADGDNIAILDAEHTENSITVGKDLTICGGTPATVIKANKNPGTGNVRIFEIGGGAAVTINDLILENGNLQADGWGGAIYNLGNLALVNCTLRNNNAHRGGAIYSAVSLLIINSTIHSNTVDDFGNIAASGGGIYAAGILGLINTTVSGNTNATTRSGDGGGLTALAGTIVGIYYSTIANNTIGAGGDGAGFSAQTGSDLDLVNTIIADNNGSVDFHNDGFLTPAKNVTNIIPTCDGLCLTFITDDPLLQPLADNGGCSPTHNLGEFSPAIGEATPFEDPVTVDQRGAERDDPDIGAVEYTLTVPLCLTSLLCEEILPVEYLSISATPQDRTVVLNWETAVEINNEGFVVERSGNGLQWQEIGFVPGSGTSEIPIAYQYVDQHPLSGTNYYRLKQIDYDGQYEYSKVLSATIGTDSAAPFRIFPNPASKLLTVQLPDDQLPYQLKLYNNLGQVVWEKATGTDRTHRILFSEFQPAAGTYWLTKTPIGRETGATETFRVVIHPQARD